MPLGLGELRARRSEIVEVARQYGATNLRVFGSVARGEADEASDLDLLVDLEPGRTLSDLVGLELELGALLGCPVDVGTRLQGRLLERIEGEVVSL